MRWKERIAFDDAASKERSLRYTVTLEEGREGGFVAICPALPGCVTQGDSRREALGNIREAVGAYIEALLKDGIPVPVESHSATERP